MDNKKTKREQIIQAAIKIFGQEGFHSAKISSIAEAAGIGKGTIYEYFKSKSQLYEEMIKYTIEIYMDSINSISLLKTTTQERLKKFVRLAFEISKEHMDIGRVHMNESGAVEENIINTMMTTQKRIIDIIEEVIQQGVDQGELRPVDTKIAALSFLGSIKYLTVYYLFIYKDGMDHHEIDEFVDLYMEGLKK